ncbi:MAG: hypothetical protein ACPHUF_04180 [Gammaproteobacteria bacterium]
MRDLHRQIALRYWCAVGDTPSKLLLVIATPRSGSTWLFDALRTYPGFYVHEHPTVLALLGTPIGRRYPLDLSGAADGENDIFASVTDKATLPVLVDGAARQSDISDSGATVALEKIHPEYFGFEFARLRKAVDRIGSDSIQFVYIVREPLAATRSFWKYKRRKPLWSGHIPIADVAEHMSKTYRAMAACADIYPGYVIDYDRMLGATKDTLKSLFEETSRSLGLPGPGEMPREALIERAIEATARERRIAGGASQFLETSGRAEAASDFDQYLVENENFISQCQAHYDRIRRSGGAK